LICFTFIYNSQMIQQFTVSHTSSYNEVGRDANREFEINKSVQKNVSARFSTFTMSHESRSLVNLSSFRELVNRPSFEELVPRHTRLQAGLRPGQVADTRLA